MRLVFTIHVIITLLMFKPATSQTCDIADWWASLDRKGWSVCSKINTYLRGFWRSDSLLGNERVGHLEVGRCCAADDRSYANQPPVCSYVNWKLTLDGFKVWALCPAGYYLNGLRLGRGLPAFLSDIEEGLCCRPQNHPNSYQDCYDEDITISFDRRGWSECQLAGYYMTGFYKSDCNNLYCIEKFRCCKMEKGVAKVGHFLDVDDETLEQDIGLNKLQMRHLRHFFAQIQAEPKQRDSSSEGKAVYSNYVARKGSNVTLTCLGYLPWQNIVRFGYDSIIFSDVGWAFNGHPITEEDTNKKATEKFQPIRGGNLFHFLLHIANVSEKDVGKYTCWQYIVANLEWDVAKGTTDLKLYESVLNVTTTQQNITVDEGSTITLQCKVKFTEAVDARTLFWLFNGRLLETMPLQKAHGNRTLSNTVKEHILSWKLKHVRLAQSGTYTCGANSTTILSTQNISVSVHDVLGPKVKQTDSIVQVPNGKTKTISCIAVYPNASYVDTFWLFNGSRKRTNSKYGENDAWLERSEGTINRRRISLTIYNARLSDSGQYSCVLNTSHGLRLKNVSVRVVPDAKGNESVDMSRTGATSSHPQTSTPTRSQTTNFVPQPSPSSNAVNDVDLLKTMLFIALGLLAGLTTMTVLVTLWYRRRCKPPASLKPPTDLDENDFNYDVFVTYSRNDFPWVERELLRLLRENQVKYCVDHLHFELGKAVVQNMVDSVYQSRKVLAVWSESYASSKYCKQELDYAIQRSFQNSDCSVIVIRLDRTGRKQLPKPLRAKTFLDYSDSVERIGWEKRLIAHLKGPDQKKNAITTIV